MVVLVLIVSEDAVDPLADHAQERLPGEPGAAWVGQRGGELLGQADAVVELADGQEPGIAGQRRG